MTRERVAGAPAGAKARVLAGRRILVVEDDFLVAEEIVHGLRRRGAEVVGPVATVGAALAVLDTGVALDGAALDVNLGRERVYPVAEALRRRGTPFVFATGYEAEFIDASFAGTPVCLKPVTPRRLAEALFP